MKRKNNRSPKLDPCTRNPSDLTPELFSNANAIRTFRSQRMSLLGRKFDSHQAGKSRNEFSGPLLNTGDQDTPGARWTSWNPAGPSKDVNNSRAGLWQTLSNVTTHGCNDFSVIIFTFLKLFIIDFVKSSENIFSTSETKVPFVICLKFSWMYNVLMNVLNCYP